MVALLKDVEFGLERAKPNSASISSLTASVLSRIYEHGCSTPASLTITLDEIAAPTLVFSQVCNSWRSLILSKPSLWSSLSWSREDEGLYGDTGFFSEEDKPLVQLWDLYLSRSRQASIDISLHLYKRDDAEIREHLLDSVFEQQHLLTSLKLYCREDTIPHGKKYIINAAPRLKILNLLAPTNPPRYVRPPKPRIRSVTIDTSSLSTLQELSAKGDVLLKQTGISNSLQSVAYFPENFFVFDNSLAFPSSISGFLSLLHCVPNIREMKFDVDSPTIPKISPQCLPLHHLSNLFLSMRTEGSKILDYILGNLDIPALEKLELFFYGIPEGDGRWHWKNGAALKSVKELVLGSHRFGDRDRSMDHIHNENLRSLLLCTPALKSLKVCAEWVSPGTLSLLTLVPSPSEDVADNLCPKLEKLSLIQAVVNPGTPHVFSYQGLIDLISSRFLRTEEDVERPELSGLKDVFIRLGSRNADGVDGPRLEDIEPIRSFIKQGLQLDAAYCHFRP